MTEECAFALHCTIDSELTYSAISLEWLLKGREQIAKLFNSAVKYQDLHGTGSASKLWGLWG